MTGKRKGKGDPWAAARANALARGATPTGTRRTPPVAPAPAGPGQRQGGPSKTELRYEAEVLAPAKLAGQVLTWWHQPEAFPLAYRCTFTPDFVVAYTDGTYEAVDVKRGGGWLHEDATIKLKFLARLRPDLRCVQAFRLQGGGWRRRVIPGGEPT